MDVKGDDSHVEFDGSLVFPRLTGHCYVRYQGNCAFPWIRCELNERPAGSTSLQWIRAGMELERMAKKGLQGATVTSQLCPLLCTSCKDTILEYIIKYD